MRHKLPAEEKRSEQIGIKVKISTREQLDYIASLEGDKLSTHIDKILTSYIEEYFSKRKISWNKIPPEERGG